MPKKKDETESALEEVIEDTPQDAAQAVTQPVEEVIEAHPTEPEWMTRLQTMFIEHTQKIDSRFDGIESRLQQAEEGKKENAQALHEEGTRTEETQGGSAAAKGTGESKPVESTKPKSRKPRIKLWRHF